MSDAASVIRSFAGRHLLVFGDVMLDEYISGEAERISAEAPVPVVRYRDVSFRAGGAANAALNAASLKGTSHLVGLVGDDEARTVLRDLVAAASIKEGLVEDRERRTTTKTRLVAGAQQVVRIDREDTSAPTREIEEALLTELENALPGVDAVLVSDYAKGAVTDATLRALTDATQKRSIPLVVDPAGSDLLRYRGATILTPNVAEAQRMLNRTYSSPEALGRELARRISPTATLLTRGSEGATLFVEGHPPLNIPATARQVFDVTGAGDTLAATLALALASGSALPTACRIATAAGSLVVEKLGTGTNEASELMDALERSHPQSPP